MKIEKYPFTLQDYKEQGARYAVLTDGGEKVHTYDSDQKFGINPVSKREFVSNMEIKHRTVEFECPIKLTHEIISKEFYNVYIILGWTVIHTYK